MFHTVAENWKARDTNKDSNVEAKTRWSPGRAPCAARPLAVHTKYSPVSRACLDLFGSSSCGCDGAARQVSRRTFPERGSEEWGSPAFQGVLCRGTEVGR